MGEETGVYGYWLPALQQKDKGDDVNIGELIARQIVLPQWGPSDYDELGEVFDKDLIRPLEVEGFERKEILKVFYGALRNDEVRKKKSLGFLLNPPLTKEELENLA